MNKKYHVRFVRDGISQIGGQSTHKDISSATKDYELCVNQKNGAVYALVMIGGDNKEIVIAQSQMEIEPPVINGYKLEILSNSMLKFGCATLDINLFAKITNLNLGLGCNRQVTSIRLNSGVEITMEQATEVLKYLKKVAPKSK